MNYNKFIKRQLSKTLVCYPMYWDTEENMFLYDNLNYDGVLLKDISEHGLYYTEEDRSAVADMNTFVDIMFIYIDQDNQYQIDYYDDDLFDLENHSKIESTIHDLLESGVSYEDLVSFVSL